MKVALVAPNPGAHTVVPPLGLGYLASHVRQRGHDVRILDLARERISAAKGAAKAAAWKPDILGVSVLSTAFLPARDFVRAFRELSPVTPVIAGGPHITAIPASVADLGADLGFAGEAEQVFPELVDRMAAGSSVDDLPGICRQSSGGMACTARAGFFDDLDSLLYPAWDLMRPDSYPDMPHQLLHKDYPVAPVLTSRGCPYDCTFCASTTLWGKKLRTRSAANVVDEIEMLVYEYGVREIHFEDDNFTQKKGHARNICEEILRRGIDIAWACPNGVRIDSLDDAMLDLMKESGCHALGLGIESGSQEVLDFNDKKLDLARVPSLIEMIKSHGIATHGFFVIGLPGETERTVRETLDFSRRTSLDRANFSLLAPLPGTEIFDKYVMSKSGPEGLDYETLNFFTPFPIGELSAGQLKSWQRRAVYRFYLRPAQMKHLVGNLRLSQVGKVFKALVDYST